MYLLDTNVISEMRKPRPHGAVVAWMRAQEPASLLLSSITLLELQERAERTRRQDAVRAMQLDTWITAIASTMTVLPADSEVCRDTARMMVKKTPDLFQDAFIAATARIHRLTLVTRNIKDFAHFDVPTFNPFTYSH